MEGTLLCNPRHLSNWLINGHRHTHNSPNLQSLLLEMVLAEDPPALLHFVHLDFHISDLLLNTGHDASPTLWSRFSFQQFHAAPQSLCLEALLLSPLYLQESQHCNFTTRYTGGQTLQLKFCLVGTVTIPSFPWMYCHTAQNRMHFQNLRLSESHGWRSLSTGMFHYVYWHILTSILKTVLLDILYCLLWLPWKCR